MDGPNLYTYVLQNPWTKFDPEGLRGAEVRWNAETEQAEAWYVNERSFRSDQETRMGTVNEDGWVDLGDGRLTTVSVIDQHGTDISDNLTLSARQIRGEQAIAQGGGFSAFGNAAVEWERLIAAHEGGSISPEVFDRAVLRTDAAVGAATAGAKAYRDLAIAGGVVGGLSIRQLRSATGIDGKPIASWTNTSRSLQQRGQIEVRTNESVANFQAKLRSRGFQSGPTGTGKTRFTNPQTGVSYTFSQSRSGPMTAYRSDGKRQTHKIRLEQKR